MHNNFFCNHIIILILEKRDIKNYLSKISVMGRHFRQMHCPGAQNF